MLMVQLASVIVRKFYVVRIAIGETKADAPLIVDGDGKLALPIPFQFMKPVAGRDS
jgi:hypothetical protein